MSVSVKSDKIVRSVQHFFMCMVLPVLSHFFYFKHGTTIKKLEDQLILVFAVLPIALFGLFHFISSRVLMC